jgi:hypothetical protein
MSHKVLKDKVRQEPSIIEAAQDWTAAMWQRLKNKVITDEESTRINNNNNRPIFRW